MIDFRPFENSDPPGIVHVWNAQPPRRAFLARLTESVLDQFVLSKLYFDRRGLIVAVDGNQCLGFAHAGFGPDSSGQQLDMSTGAICLVLSHPAAGSDNLDQQLRERAEQYLAEEGAEVIFGGAHSNLAPFYLGLYGGSDLCGVLDSDERQTRLFRDAGYESWRKTLVLQLQLADFRAPMNRDLLRVRRQFRVESSAAPRPTHWWPACCAAHHEQTEFRLIQSDRTSQRTSVVVWDMEPLAGGWGVTAAGLNGWEEVVQHTEPVCSQFLLAETCKQLQSQGVGLVEIQIDAGNEPAQQILEGLGFRPIDVGVVYRKP
jgi:hypothetical protein